MSRKPFEPFKNPVFPPCQTEDGRDETPSNNTGAKDVEAQQDAPVSEEIVTENTATHEENNESEEFQSPSSETDDDDDEEEDDDDSDDSAGNDDDAGKQSTPKEDQGQPLISLHDVIAKHAAGTVPSPIESTGENYEPATTSAAASVARNQIPTAATSPTKTAIVRPQTPQLPPIPGISLEHLNQLVSAAVIAQLASIPPAILSSATTTTGVDKPPSTPLQQTASKPPTKTLAQGDPMFKKDGKGKHKQTEQEVAKKKEAQSWAVKYSEIFGQHADAIKNIVEQLVNMIQELKRKSILLKSRDEETFAARAAYETGKLELKAKFNNEMDAIKRKYAIVDVTALNNEHHALLATLRQQLKSVVTTVQNSGMVEENLLQGLFDMILPEGITMDDITAADINGITTVEFLMSSIESGGSVVSDICSPPSTPPPTTSAAPIVTGPGFNVYPTQMPVGSEIEVPADKSAAAKAKASEKAAKVAAARKKEPLGPRTSHLKKKDREP